MARIVLITGGSRSGKSAYAQEMAERLPGARAIVATCPVLDDEMAERIRKHKEARDAAQWTTIEEPCDLAGVIRNAASFDVLLVDCVTLWVNNLMYEEERGGRLLTEEDAAQQCEDVLAAAHEFDGTAIFVTNEVTMGIIPDNPSARRYRDLVGRCNQILAQAADEVVLMVCGLPVTVKCG